MKDNLDSFFLMDKYKMDEDDLRKWKCKNIGCNRVLSWREELRRHKRGCNRPNFQKIVKYKAENGMF